MGGLFPAGVSLAYADPQTEGASHGPLRPHVCSGVVRCCFVMLVLPPVWNIAGLSFSLQEFAPCSLVLFWGQGSFGQDKVFAEGTSSSCHFSLKSMRSALADSIVLCVFAAGALRVRSAVAQLFAGVSGLGPPYVHILCYNFQKRTGQLTLDISM